MILDADGSEYDWQVGYGPPPEKFEASLQKSLNGEDAYKTLLAAYAKNPKDIAAVFGLAQKYSSRYDEANQAKGLEKYKEVIALDPEGKLGSYTLEHANITVPYTEYAEYIIATRDMFRQKADMAPVKAFIAKYPGSKLVKQAYSGMAYYYGQQAPKEEAAKFFAEYTVKYPSDARAADMWLARVNKDKGPLEQGQILVDKIKELTSDNPVPDINQDIADFYILKGDKAKADEIYGKNFMDDRVQSFAYGLLSYANFWVEQKANEDSAVAMAELAYKMQPDNDYLQRQLAGVYMKTNHEDKALALFGPAYLQGVGDNAMSLYSYAYFWAGQGKNLESALEAAKKSVELKPGTSYYWTTLSDIYMKMKNYPEALKAAEKSLELTEAPYQARIKQKIEAIKKAQAEEKK